MQSFSRDSLGRSTRRLRSLVSLGIAASLVLAGCGNGEADSPAETTAATTTSGNETSETTTSDTPTSSMSMSDTPDVEPAPETDGVAAIDPAPVAEAPYVVECLVGSPGPARWSDGTAAFSQECYDRLTANRGDYQCPRTDHFVHDPADCERPVEWDGDSGMNHGDALIRPPEVEAEKDAAHTWWADCLSVNDASYCSENDPWQQ